MLNYMISWSLANRAIILCLAILIMATGIRTATNLPVEVLPDLTKPTVTILTEAPGLSPEEVESQVTIPVESVLMGVPGLTRLRNRMSVFHLSMSSLIGIRTLTAPAPKSGSACKPPLTAFRAGSNLS